MKAAALRSVFRSWVTWVVLAGILGVTVGVILYVQAALRDIQHRLPVTLFDQVGEATLLSGELSDLLRAVQLARLAPSPVSLQASRAQVDRVAARIKVFRATYQFDNLIGASAIHAAVNPAITDIDRWLTDGVYGFAPGTDVVLRLAETRIINAEGEVRRLLKAAEAAAVEILAEQGVKLDRFRTQTVVTLVLLAVMGSALVVIFIGRSVAEHAHRVTEARFHAIIDHSPLSICMKDLEGRYLLVNRGFCEAYEVTADEVRDKTNAVVVADPEAAQGYREHERRVLTERQPITEQYEEEQAGGTRTILETKFPVENEKGEVIAIGGISADITALKATETLLREAKEDAEVANRAKSEFLAHMSHELRTPLNAIIGFSEIIASEMLGNAGNRKYVDYASDITLAGQFLQQLIDDILDISKIEVGKVDLEEVVFDVTDVIGSALRLVDRRAEENQVRLGSELADDLPWLKADARLVKQAVLNLLSNGIKFTPAGGHVEVVADVSEAGALHIDVSDTGVGMAPEEIPRALESFGRGRQDPSIAADGTGLGLYLSRKSMEAHGGILEIDSAPGAGTRVSLVFPPERTVPPEAAAAAGD